MPPHDLGPWTHPKILYVEDDVQSFELVRKLLSAHGYEVLEANDGISGIQKAEAELPDLILMDLNLPGLDGFEAATKLKSSEKLRATPIIAITGNAYLGDKERSLVAGCDGYLSKPIDVDKFPGQIDEFLRGKREQIAQDKNDSFYKQYSERLVSRLQKKVVELQQSNDELNQSYQLLEHTRARLQNFSDGLLDLSFLIQALQMVDKEDDLIERLPRWVCERLGFHSCILLSTKIKIGRLIPISAHAVDFNLLHGIEILTTDPLVQKILERRLTVYFSRTAKISQGVFHPVFDILKANSLVVTPLVGKKEILDEALLDSGLEVEIILIADKTPLTSHDWRILRTLAQSASLVSRNLKLTAHLRTMYHQAEELSITDGLTGLYNYRYFHRRLLAEYNRAQRYDLELSLIMFDIDFFKHYNDTYGHPAGDLILKTVGETLRRHTRQSDFAVRYGGEEFCLLLPETSKSAAFVLAEKIRKAIESTPFPKEETQPNKKITISGGVATYPADARDGEELVWKADTALYHAKQLGRNQVMGI